MHTLRLENCSKKYENRVVVNNFSLSVISGKISVLLGSNGSGKTTIFDIITGATKIDSGRVLFDSIDITSLSTYKRARLGISYLMQESAVFGELTVEENILGVLQVRNRSESKAAIINGVDKAIDLVRLSDIRTTKVKHISGGERRRLEIARSICLDPKFVILDEPFAAVDPVSILLIQDVVLHLAKSGMGVLITDHSFKHALSIADECSVIYKGNLVIRGDKEVVVADTDAQKLYFGPLG